MGKGITSLSQYIHTLIDARWRFLFLFLLVFFTTLLLLSMLGIVPEYRVQETRSPRVLEAAVHTTAEEPQYITIPSVGIDINIENPQDRDIAVLDRALERGVVHYPGTGTLAEDANVFLFGHSSYLPNVLNKNYQAFNNLQKVERGDEVFVDSDNMRYVYRVASVVLAEADEVTIDLSRGERMLTLSTCNSFGEKSERYVVEALYVGSYLLTI